MEPAINPGLEAQAAARIHRLGEILLSLSAAPHAPCKVSSMALCVGRLHHRVSAVALWSHAPAHGPTPVTKVRGVALVAAGQTKRTKVVRLLAEGTVEAAILKMQERKLASAAPEEPETAILGQSEVDASTLVNIMNDHPPLPK